MNLAILGLKSAKNAKIPENKLNFKQKEGIEDVITQ